MIEFEFTGEGEVILFPLIQKFRKVSNFTQVSITQATNKQSNNNYINIPKSGMLQTTTLKMNLVLEIRRG